MNRLDLTKFDGHKPERFHNISLADNIAGIFAPPDRRLLRAAPDLLAELKETRKEIEELRESNKVFKDWNDELQRLLNDSIDGQKEAAELRERIDRALERLRYNASQGSSVENFPIIQELEGKQ